MDYITIAAYVAAALLVLWAVYRRDYGYSVAMIGLAIMTLRKDLPFPEAAQHDIAIGGIFLVFAGYYLQWRKGRPTTGQ